MADKSETRAVYDNYEISGCRDRDDGAGRFVEPCSDAEAGFWTLYGHINGRGAEAIGDFNSREAAEEVYSRITGQPFGSHEEIEARLRLMHAAPNLLDALAAALPIVEEQLDIAYCWSNDDGIRGDSIDWQLGRMRETYAEATGRQPNEVRIMLAIERLRQADWFDFDELDERKVIPFHNVEPDGFDPVVGEAWSRLEKAQREYALAGQIEWSGFTPDQIAQVIRNVVAGTPKERWFSGDGQCVDSERSHNALQAPAQAGVPGTPEAFPTQQRRHLFEEWKEDYQAARVRDYGAMDAASYEARVIEGARMSPASEPPHPWPSEVAREQKQKPNGMEQGSDKPRSRDDGYSM